MSKKKAKSQSLRRPAATPAPVEISCREVLREISNFIEKDIDEGLRDMLQRHFAICQHCTAVLDGTRNVIRLSGDDRTFTLPADFSERLQRKLAARSRGQ